jgi:hypothetical protein
MTTGSALVARKQLNPCEEAKAVRAMLDRGLTEDGAAQAFALARGPHHGARVSAAGRGSGPAGRLKRSRGRVR